MKWDCNKRYFGVDDILPLWVADMDFEVCPEIVKAIQQRANHFTFGYTKPGEQYYKSFINWNKKRNNYDIKKEWILNVSGVIPAFKAAIYAFTEIGDKVLIQTPVYPPFHKSVNVSGRKLVKNSLQFDGEKYQIDFDDFEKKIKDGVKLFVLCSPHNPIGRVWTKDELAKIVDICYLNNVIIASDEIHSDLVFEGYKHIPTAMSSENAKNITITCMAPSKTFNIAGLKSAAIVVENDELRDKIDKALKVFGQEGVNIFGYTAFEAAYTYGERWLEELLVYLQNNIIFVNDYIKTYIPKIKTFKPEGTYLMWLDFSEYGLTQNELVNKLVKEAKVGLNNGLTFGDEGIGFMRLNIGTPKSILEEGLYKIRKVFSIR